MVGATAVWDIVFAGVVALATAVSTFLTFKVLGESKRLREAQHDPHVSVYVRVSDRSINLLELVVVNDGGGPAYDIQFQIREDFRRTGPALNESFLVRPWKFLGVGQRRETSLGSALGIDKDRAAAVAKILVSWRGADKREHKEEVILDLGELIGTRGVAAKPLYTIAKAAEESQRALERLVKLKERELEEPWPKELGVPGPGKRRLRVRGQR